jgi:nuclear GTP-binding protein
VFGYPNVGKSSLINSLKRAKAVGVSPCPGFTKTVTQVHLDNQIKLIDCPGVVFDTTSGLESDTAVILRNAVGANKVADPIKVVEAIIARCHGESLSRHYKIAAFANVNTFLMHISRTRGKLQKGGGCDLEGAARVILLDWNTGKIPFYTLPPVPQGQGQGQGPVEEEAVIVGGWAKEFNIDDLLQEDDKLLNATHNNPSASDFVSMQPSSLDVDMGAWREGESGDDDDEQMKD